MEDVSFNTDDNTELSATLFESNAGLPGKGSLVLISSAMGIPRKFYRHFAQYMADNGARAVMTYDYRCIGHNDMSQHCKSAKMSDWALKDLPAAVRFLTTRYPQHHLSGLGHSFGGQALGLSGVSEKFDRYMTLSSGSGYLGYMKNPANLNFKLNRIAYPVSLVLRHFPFGEFGTKIPHGIFNQWRKWCNSHDYFMSDPSLPETRRFADVHIPIMSVGFEDDPYATLASVEALMAWYSRADVRLRWFTMEDTHDTPIGHSGFFKPEHSETLWPQISDWLVREAISPDSPPA